MHEDKPIATGCSSIRPAHRARALAAALAATALAVSGAAAQNSTERPREPPGEPMTSEELQAVHAGHDMEGCYVDRPEDPVWRERMAEDGRLYDLEKGGAEVGRWWIQKGGIICFLYSDREPGPFCFTGRRRGDVLDFYSAFGGELVATTECVDPPIA